MEIVRIAVIGVITAIVVIMLKDHRADIALLVGLAGGIIILLSVIDYLGEIFGFMSELTQKAGIDGSIIKILIKIVGIGYIADFAAGIVEDSGSRALAEKVALAGKLMILVISLPIIRLLIEIVSGILT